MALSRKRMLAIIAGFLVLVLLGGVMLVERTRGAWELEKILGELRAAKVELDPARLVTNSVPEEENVAMALLAMTNELQGFRLPEEVGPIPLMKVTDAGEARSFMRSNSWSRPGGKRSHWDEPEEAHAEALPLYQKLVEISGRPRFASVQDVSKGMADMEIRGLALLPSVIRVVRLVGAYELHKGNDERAAEAAITLLNVFPNKSEDHWNIAESVRWTYAWTGMSLTWELIQNAKLSDATWKRLQEAWERCEFVEGYSKAARMEAAGMSDYFVRLKEAGAYRMNIIGKFEEIERDYGANWSPPVRGMLLRRVHLPMWRMMWADQDYAYTMRHFATEVHLSEFARTNSWVEVRREAARKGREDFGFESGSWADENFYDRLRYLFSFSPQSPFVKVNLLRAMQTETDARLCVASIALRRYHVAEGKYPEKVDELVPRFLAEVPRDLMDGKELKYRRVEGGGFLLYSSGVNGKDDGGSIKMDEGGYSRGHIWGAEDVVWPRRVE